MLKKIQDEVFEYSCRNFGKPPIPIKCSIESFLGIVEEVGEVAHSILKMSEGINGTDEEHWEKIKDGIADIIIFTLDFAARNNLDAEKLVTEVWAKVKQRDYSKNKFDGNRT